jgi:hypothetical protein
MKLQIATTVAALALAGAAFAQQPAPGPGGGAPPSPEMQAARAAMRDACAADMKTLCDGKEGREAMICIARDNADKASQGCKDAIAKMRSLAPPRQ